jgi:hypothetical protein
MPGIGDLSGDRRAAGLTMSAPAALNLESDSRAGVIVLTFCDIWGAKVAG